MAGERKGWQRFQRLTFDGRTLSKRAKRVEGVTVRHARKFIVNRLDRLREVRRHIVSWLVLMALMIGLVGAQFVWFSRSYQTMAQAKGGAYAEATLGTIDTLNPLYATSSSEVAASHLLFSSLYTYDATGALSGDLAQSMEVDTKQTTYTITVRPHVKWHDGTTLTARDVAFTVNLIKDPEARSPLRVNWQDISVKALDDQRVQFTLPAVYAAFPHALTFAVLPAHILRDVPSGSVRESTFSRSPVGSGPFQLKLLQTASDHHKIVQMTAWDNYYRGRPLLDRFEIHGFDTNTEILRALKTGQVSAAADLPQADVGSVPAATYTVFNHTIDSVVYAIFNTTHVALKDPALRRALQAATDTASIRKLAAPDSPKADYPILPQLLTSQNLPTIPKSTKAEAANLFDQAGWKLDGSLRKKDGQVLKIEVATTKDSQYAKTVEALANHWRSYGIQVNVTIYDTSDPSVNFVRDVLQPRNYDVLVYELAIGGDPDVYAYWHSSQIGTRGYNFANYSSGPVDDALSSARLTLDPNLRTLKYQAFITQWLADVPAVGLYQPVVYYAENKHITSVDPSGEYVSSYSRYTNVLYWSTNDTAVYKTP